MNEAKLYDMFEGLKVCLLKRGVTGHRSRVLSSVKLKMSDDAEKENDNDHRVFCFTVDASKQIFFAGNLMQIPLANQIGILVHEIAHIVKGKDEAMCDLWIREKFSDIGYSYVDRVDYEDWCLDDQRTAKHIESVSQEFVQEVLDS